MRSRYAEAMEAQRERLSCHIPSLYALTDPLTGQAE